MKKAHRVLDNSGKQSKEDKAFSALRLTVRISGNKRWIYAYELLPSGWVADVGEAVDSGRISLAQGKEVLQELVKQGIRKVKDQCGVALRRGVRVNEG